LNDFVISFEAKREICDSGEQLETNVPYTPGTAFETRDIGLLGVLPFSEYLEYPEPLRNRPLLLPHRKRVILSHFFALC